MFYNFIMFIMIILMLVAFLVPQILGGLADMFLKLYIPHYELGLMIAVFSAIYLWRYTKRRKMSIIRMSGKTAKMAVIFLLPQIINIIISAVQFATGERVFGGLTFQVIVLSLMAGISEEVAFRAVPISYIMREKPKKSTIPLAAFITSFFFGAIHLTNMVGGVTFPMAAYQSVFAFCVGMLYVAVFLRTKSILPSMICHFINDVVGLMDAGNTADGLITSVTFSYLEYIDMVFAAAFLITGIFLLRPSKHEEILTLWREQPDEQPQSEENT